MALSNKSWNWARVTGKLYSVPAPILRDLRANLRAMTGVGVLKKIKDNNGSIPDILEWSRCFEVQKKNWLILGKGPSYSQIKNVNLNDYYTFSLNHVVREQPVDVAHVIDIDVVEDCKTAIVNNARFLIIPFFPHVKKKPTRTNIYEFVEQMPVLKLLRDQKRLVWYNLSSSKKQVDSSPTILAEFFSAEAAVNILAEWGIKTIRSLGVDGGSSYAPNYKDLNGKTLLANKQHSFDCQFANIARTIRTKKIFYAPLHKEAPIRIFVGTDRTQILAARVLEYSVKKFASMSVDLIPMVDMPIPMPKDPNNRPRTGFSFSRFLIPSLCGYTGRAIYLDADMLVLSDIAKLWDLPMDGAHILCAEQPSKRGRIRQYSVMLLNCSRLPWQIDEIVNGLDMGRYNYQQLMYDVCLVSSDKISAAIPYEWNSLEFYRPGKTCLIHYTDMPTQPWVSPRNRRGGIWYRILREAVAEGFILREEIYREVEQGHVSPVLPRKIGLPPHVSHKRLVKDFVAPYRKFQR
jgi:Glycosyl transferase family 8